MCGSALCGFSVTFVGIWIAWICIVIMYGHVWLCRVMYGYLGSCKVIWSSIVMHGLIRSSMVMCGQAYLCMVMHVCILYMVMVMHGHV